MRAVNNSLETVVLFVWFALRIVLDSVTESEYTPHKLLALNKEGQRSFYGCTYDRRYYLITVYTVSLTET